jgi:hypothetical protein
MAIRFAYLDAIRTRIRRSGVGDRIIRPQSSFHWSERPPDGATLKEARLCHMSIPVTDSLHVDVFYEGKSD